MTKNDTVSCQTQPLGDGTLLSVEGEINYNHSPTLRNHLMVAINQNCRRLVVDLSGVPYMDSSGVATLVEALQVQRRKGGKLVLCCLQPKVRGIFEISRLDMVFTIVPDAQAAAQA